MASELGLAASAFAFNQDPGALHTEALEQEALVLLVATSTRRDCCPDFLSTQTLGRPFDLPTGHGVETPRDVRYLKARVEGLRGVIAECRHAGVGAKVIVSVSAQDRGNIRGSSLVLDRLQNPGRERIRTVEFDDRDLVREDLLFESASARPPLPETP